MAEDHHPEIVIVRRHARHAEEHHGGAWKIAFADFMTAMMALFLVLWLIGSTSEKERRAVAQYFNPVKLVDMTTVKKGFHEPKETEMGSGSVTDPPASEPSTHESSQRAAEPAVDRAKEEKSAGRAGGKTPPGHIAISPDAPAGKRQEAREPAAPAARSVARHSDSVPAALASDFADPFATLPEEPLTAAASATSPAKGAAPGEPELATLASDIMEDAASDAGQRSGPKLEVRATDEGVLISLTDAADATMFSSSSAEPRRETIEMMQRIARSLATRPGAIVVRGHTDARPYRSGTSDNWRLSTARAHAARDVLLRGGLAESRIERVEGYADRSPKVAADPTAPENRRIEILLRKASE